jgi:hypothetical protein
LTGLDLRRHRHAGRQRNPTIFCRHPILRQSDPGKIDRVSVQRDGITIILAARLAALRITRRRADSVARHSEYPALHRAVECEVKGFDPGPHGLPGSDEADIAILHRGLDHQTVLRRDNRQQRLGRCHHAADGVDRELLNRPIDRRVHLDYLLDLLRYQGLASKPSDFRRNYHLQSEGNESS